jgi:hypothetical protein
MKVRNRSRAIGLDHRANLAGFALHHLANQQHRLLRYDGVFSLAFLASRIFADGAGGLTPASSAALELSS